MNIKNFSPYKFVKKKGKDFLFSREGIAFYLTGKTRLSTAAQNIFIFTEKER